MVGDREARDFPPGRARGRTLPLFREFDFFCVALPIFTITNWHTQHR
jgi:hypothetical protein